MTESKTQNPHELSTEFDNQCESAIAIIKHRKTSLEGALDATRKLFLCYRELRQIVQDLSDGGFIEEAEGFKALINKSLERISGLACISLNPQLRAALREFERLT